MHNYYDLSLKQPLKCFVTERSKEGKEGGRERRRKKGRKENSYNTLSSIFDSFKKKLKL